MPDRKISYPVLFFVLTAFLITAGCYRKPPEQRAETMVGKIAERLNLNDTQKTKLNAIKDEFLSKGKAVQKTRQETSDQMIALMRSPEIDQGELKALAEKNKAQMNDFVDFFAAKTVEFHDMLTPEQREKAAAEMERWKERFRESRRK